MPKLSVIIPNYNHARYLVQRIESVLGQTYQNMEVIILDDSSTDNSKEIIEQYRHHPKVSKIIYNEKNSGSTFYQWNKGVAEAAGEYIWIAESDDIARSKELVATLVNCLDKNENLGIAYSQSVNIDQEGNELGDLLNYTYQFNPNIWAGDFQMSGNEFINKYLFFQNVIPNASAVIFRKSFFIQSGMADTSLRLFGDWLVWLKMSNISEVIFVAKPYNSFRTHSNNVRSSTNRKQGIKESILMMQSLQKSMNPLPPSFDVALSDFMEKFMVEVVNTNDLKFHHEVYQIVEKIVGDKKKTKILLYQQMMKENYIDACLVQLQSKNWYVGAKRLMMTGIITKNLWYYLKSIIYWTLKRKNFRPLSPNL
jgi:glycosyltransferase involved in cell wall biosynthesis